MRETLPALPLADTLGELSRMDRGAVLESMLAVVPRHVRVEARRARRVPLHGLDDPVRMAASRGLRACADLAGQGRVRRDQSATLAERAGLITTSSTPLAPHSPR
jgi:hypothetical protein